MSNFLMTILMTRPVEDLVGWALSNNRAHDSGLIKNHPSISTTHPTPTISLDSPDCGPSGSKLAVEYGSSTIGGKDRIPNLTWTVPDDLKSQVKEWILTCEDPDAPMKDPIIHGIYHSIPVTKTSVTQSDFEKVSEDSRQLKGGFVYGKNRRGNVYIPPRPVVRHGPHRYFWTVIGLSEKVDWAEEVGLGELLKAVEGKVLGWGEWIGTYERR